MTIEFPLFMQAKDYSARLVRALVANGHDEGVMDWASYLVTQRAAGANFTVDVAAGKAIVAGDDQSEQGNYYVRSTAVESVSIDTQAGGTSRYDLIVLQINDSNAGGAAGDNALPKVIKGTAGSPGVPPSLPNSAILLATVGPIVSGTASITNSLITEGRTLAGKRDEPGTIKLRASARVPSGWLACDGSAVSRTTYAALFAEIGTSYGVGNGTTTFNLPDSRGRALIPVKSGQAQVDTIGETGGDYNLQAHTHTAPAHVHNMDHVDPPSDVLWDTDGGSAGPWASVGVSAAGGGGIGLNVALTSSGVAVRPFKALASYTGDTGSAGGSATTSTGSGAGENMPPYQVVGLAVIRT